MVTMTLFPTRLARSIRLRISCEASTPTRVYAGCASPPWHLQQGRFQQLSKYSRQLILPFVESNGALLATRRHFHAAASPLVVDCPGMGDSITEGTLNEWKQPVGAFVEEGSVVAVIETDKVSVDISAQASGQLTKVFAKEGEAVFVGKPLYELDTSAARPSAEASTSPPVQNKEKSTSSQEKSTSSQEETRGTQLTSSASGRSVSQASQPPKVDSTRESLKQINAQALETINAGFALDPQERIERRVPMSRMRQRIAERLKGAQNTAAMLSTFNECDMSNLMALRSEMNEAFQEKYGVKMDIENNDIVYKDYVDISVAVATPTGLMVPVVRDCQRKSWAELELALAELAKKARANQIAIEDMVGGTFTISNGGVYGSMLGTPILNPPQASILGMHAISKRPVVRNNEIVIRPIMYLALTYDHRLVDGREAVLFLCSIRDYIEDPRKMLLGL